MEKHEVIGSRRVKCSEVASAPQDTGWAALEAKLIAVGGERGVALPEPHLDFLLGHGQAFARRPTPA